ncbi:MAG: beta-N-acetylhexosaminidase [Candidatus Methanomethylicia archaeon]
MDLDLLAGQMIMMGFDGLELNSEIMDALKRIKPCGLVFFRRNMANWNQVKKLIRDLQNYASSIGLPPLIIALDHEGGPVFRMASRLTPLPSAMALGASNDPSMVDCIARIAGQELKALGFNLNFAPVADLNTNPRNPVIGIRSFGDDPFKVANMVSRYVSSLQSTGVMATAKHFPGHGDTSVDSHLDLPIVDIDLNVLLNRELIPFKAAIDAGVSCIMTSHVCFPRVDSSNLPATFSKYLLRDVLRGMLGFNGVIISDALEMKAISSRFDVDDVALYGLNAGLNILLRGGDLNYIFDLKDSILKLVKSGEVDPKLLYDSYIRIEALRNKINSYSSPIEVSIKNLRKNRMLSMDVSLSSITLLKSDLFRPLKGYNSIAILIPKMLQRFLSNFSSEVVNLFVGEFGSYIDTLVISFYDEDVNFDDLMDIVYNVDGVVFFTYNAIFHRFQLDLYEKIKDRVLMVVAAGSPYDAELIDGDKPIALTYGLNPIVLSALVDVLCGVCEAHGIPPVKLNLKS